MATHEPASIKTALGKAGLYPLEEKLETAKSNRKLVIGIPSEPAGIETRVCLTPEAVELMVSMGHEVYIETNAGLAANYCDNDYSERGGQIVPDRRSVMQSEIILKVSTPSKEDINMMRGNQVIISSLHTDSHTAETIRMMMSKKITALAFETIKDDNDCYPIMRSMSAIAGTRSVLLAAEFLSTHHGGKGVLLGGVAGITPVEVVIIGAGTAAESAVRAAFGLGAHIRVFDNSVNSLVQLQNNLGSQLYTSVYHPKVLEKALKSADVVIGARQSHETGPRFYVTEDMVKSMKKGSVIIDISTVHGGCIETSKPMTISDKPYTKHGIIHYCVPNLPASVARTSSIALSNVFMPLMLTVSENGGFLQQLKNDRALRQGVYIFNGILTNHLIGHYLNIPSKDIDLLMAAF